MMLMLPIEQNSSSSTSTATIDWDSRKIRHYGTNKIVAAKTRKPNGPQSNGSHRRSQTKNERQECHSHVIVLGIHFFLFEVMWMVIGKVVKESNLGGG